MAGSGSNAAPPRFHFSCGYSMRSLFFWRKKGTSATTRVAPQDGRATPGTEGAASVAEEPLELPAKPLSLQRLVYALALSDPRAADMDARPDPEHVQLMLDASAQFAR